MNKKKMRRQKRSDLASVVESAVESVMADWKRRDEEAMKAGMGRRAFIRAFFGIASAIGFIADVGGVRSFATELLDLDADERLLREVFGIKANMSAALVPAANHPWKQPPSRLGWYPIEGSCCDAFRSRFLPGVTLRTVTGYPQIRRDDSLYLFGSQVSNLIARRYLGRPILEEPIFTVKTADWRVNLRWNLHTPAGAPTAERMQYGELWTTKKHVIADRHGDSYQSRSTSGLVEDDYLLLTVLPRFSTGAQRIFIFGGIHGPGTRAATLLFTAPPVKLLRELLQSTRREPYYQALFNAGQ